MFFEELTDDEWTRLAPLAADEPVHPHRRGRPRAEPRVVTNAVLWILTTGERWSKLPARYPSGPTCRRRFDDWLADGTLVHIVKVLSEFGRTFAYVPEPDVTVQVAPKAAPLPVPESPRLRGVFWTNPESWHTADECPEADGAYDGAIDDANSACMHTARGEAPVASSRRAPTPGALLRSAAERSPLVDSMAVTKRSDDYRDYMIHAVAQPVEKQLQVSYRASAEIVKDGQRVERSGLIGPRFADHDSAERYALDWGRDWIDRHEAAALARPEAVESMPVAAPPQVQPAQEHPQSAPALAAATAPQSQRALDPSMIRGRAPEWLLRADSRGDTKPPELLYHA
ncbi:transposase [Trinickia acidisoli]|uniref:transposase n=1 Tax=Trinickia acidisoli TaxID=2767482 RepID=UPI001A8DF801|nr:transposase [Trinickia acidisoli]